MKTPASPESSTAAYSLTSNQLIQSPSLRLADRLNGGLLHFRRGRFDWDLVEWFLKQEDYVIHPYWKEQTAWSVLAAATGCWFWDEDWVRVITKKSDLAEPIAVAHFISSYRELIKYAAGSPSNAPAVTVSMSPFGECTRTRFASRRVTWFLERARKRLHSGLYARRSQQNAT